MGTTPRAADEMLTPRRADEMPTPRGGVRVKGILRPREYLPMRSSQWGAMRSKLLVDTADEQPAAGFQGDSVAFVSPLSRTIASSNAKTTRMQEIFTQKLTAIYEKRTKASKALSNTSLFEAVVKQGFLDVCEGERASVAQRLRNNAPMHWQRMWVSLSAAKGLLVYSAHTQDLMDPVQAIEVKSILHCKAEDTCVFSVESMIDDFLGSWSFFFRAESRAERDAWITALDRQIVGQSPMTSANRHAASSRRTLASPTSSKLQSPVSARNSIKISALISPRSASSANHRQPPSTKRRRFLDDTDAELKKLKEVRETTEAYMDEVQETLQELEQMRNVLWCKDISSVATAQKIRASFRVKSNKAREAVAMKQLIQASDLQPELAGDDMIMVSPSGRLGCMVVFDSESEAKNAMKAISFYANHDGESLASQVITEGQIAPTANLFSSDSDLQVPSTGNSSAVHPVFTASGSEAREKDEDERQQPQTSHAKGAPDSSATGILQPRAANRPAGWSFQNDRLMSSIAQRRQKKEAEINQKRNSQSRDAVSAKLRAMSVASRKVELRALLPNPTAFSYFLIRYDLTRSSIEMEYVTNEKTHSLWTGAITDVAVAPTSKGGNVNVLGGGQCAMQVGQRQWDHFASMAKTATFMAHALEKHMLDPIDLERHEAKYSNVQEPVTDRIFVGKTRQQATRHWRQERKNTAATKNTGATSARTTVETDTATFDIGMHEFSDILAELSELPKDKVAVSEMVDPDVLGLVSEIATTYAEHQPEDDGYDFTTMWLNSIVQGDNSTSTGPQQEKVEDGQIIVKEAEAQLFKLPTMEKSSMSSQKPAEPSMVPATQKPRNTLTHTRPKIVPPLRVPAAVHGGRVDTWDHRTRHDGLANPHLKLNLAETRSSTARILTHGDIDPKISTP